MTMVGAVAMQKSATQNASIERKRTTENVCKTCTRQTSPLNFASVTPNRMRRSDGQRKLFGAEARIRTSVARLYSFEIRRAAIFTNVKLCVAQFSKDGTGRKYAALANHKMIANASGRETTSGPATKRSF